MTSYDERVRDFYEDLVVPYTNDAVASLQKQGAFWSKIARANPRSADRKVIVDRAALNYALARYTLIKMLDKQIL